MFTIDMLPAQHGDCLWVEYGPAQSPSRVIIDGGTASTWKHLKAKILALPAAQRRVELLVITHIDADHIGGALELLKDPSVGLSIGDVWFNGYRHIASVGGARGALQGEAVTELLEARKLPWNRAFEGKAVVVLPDAPLPRVTLPGGMVLTLLSPTPKELTRLQGAWEKECRDAGVTPGGHAKPRKKSEDRELSDEVTGVTDKAGRKKKKRQYAGGAPDVPSLAGVDFEQDTAEANGSSIAFLAEFDGKRCLFTGDAYPVVLMDSLERLFGEQRLGSLTLDAIKLPHHGSRANLNWELLYRIDCARYLFSTDGSVFDHPDPESVARVITYGGHHPELFFNYRSEESSPWADASLARARGFVAHFPPEGSEGMHVSL